MILFSFLTLYNRGLLSAFGRTSCFHPQGDNFIQLDTEEIRVSM